MSYKSVSKPEPDPTASREDYYEAAGSWAQDRQDALRTSRRVAWIVASVAVVVALFEATALVLLTPLKTVEPYTLMVDRNTGYVQALKPIDAQKIAPDTALTQSFLVQYVIARESFDIDEMQANYRKVALWSANPARSDYISSVQVSNPGSPLARYPRSTTIETLVKSVSPLGGNAALVRFETHRRDAGAQPAAARSWVAVIRYQFSTEPVQQSDRYLNPLGFQVLRYRRDQEQAPVSDPTTVTGQPSDTTMRSEEPRVPQGYGVAPVQNGSSPIPSRAFPAPGSSLSYPNGLASRPAPANEVRR